MKIWHFVGISLAFALLWPAPAQTDPNIHILLNTLKNWFDELRIGGNGPRFSQLMNDALRAQTFAIVDTVRGWALTAHEEHAWRNDVLRFMRWATLRLCVAFVQRHADSHRLSNDERTSLSSMEICT